MRSLEQARASWQELQQYSSLRDLKDAVRLDAGSSAATRGLRSACWKAFLLFDTLSIDEWQRTLASSRSAYNSLRAHFFRYIENPDDVGAGNDPLSQDSEAHQDEELRAEILQDVDRCMPENPYFRQHETQTTLLDILFVFCKLNPDVGYRQGMHEIAAPILWVLQNEAIDIGEGSKALGEDAIIKTVFDAEHIEHDTFAIFGQVMQNAKNFYISDGPVSIASRSRHIFNEILPQVDRELMKHLESLDVVPQVYLIRWIRLLFGREFEFDSVLMLWDVILAEDQTLEIVDHICIAMLLRIRWYLLDADYNSALGILLRYPEQDKDFAAQTFALDALYLRTHMTIEGGSYLILKYTGRSLTSGRPSTPPALQRNITTFAVQRRQKISPPRTPRSSRNIEAMLQTTAKNIYARGEKLGIGKAVRSAVDEVHKKAQEIRDSQASPARPGSGLLINRMRDLELRNRRLSELLAGAVDELWEYQKLVARTESTDDQPKTHAQDDSVDKLSAAIAKVQFVQVYLDEPTLALPEDDQAQNDPAEKSFENPRVARTAEPSDSKQAYNEKTASNDVTPPFQGGLLADPSTFEDFAEEAAPESVNEHLEVAGAQKPSNIWVQDTDDVPAAKAPPSSPPPRPSLEQSSFSFMLGQESSDVGAFGKAETPPRARSRAGISLFGNNSSRTQSTSRTPLDSKKDDEPDNDFDLSSLRRAKITK